MKQERPNIVIVLTDQHRADVSAREGFPLDTTPFLDELANRGVWFDKAYTSSPLCCPARTSLFTGRFPSAHRVTQNPAAADAVFDTDVFQVAKAAGYATALIGKNHTYLSSEDVDCFIEFSHGGQIGGEKAESEAEFDDWLNGLRHRTFTTASPYPVDLQNPFRIVSSAIEWIESVPPEQPFLLVVSFPEPHNPYQVSEPYFSLFPVDDLPETPVGEEALTQTPFSWRYVRELGEHGEESYAEKIPRARANYFGMLRLIDDQLRRLLPAVEDRDRGSVMLITADHGDYVGEYGLMRKGAELPEVLVRIPLVIVGSGIPPSAGPHPAHVSLVDIFPTICEMIGASLDLGIQGRSLWPLLTRDVYPATEFDSVYAEQGMGGLPYEAEDVGDPMPGLFDDGPAGSPRFDELNAVTQSGQRRMVRKGRWKLVVDNLGRARVYDLETDPFELVDLSEQSSVAAIVIDLFRELAVWAMRAEDPLPPIEHGYPLKRDPRNYYAPYASD